MITAGPLARRSISVFLAASLVACVGGRLPAPGSPPPAATLTAAPSSDIFWAPLERTDDGLSVGNPRRVTDRPGYDNQPSFGRDGRTLLYTSIREQGQADIWSYDIERGTHHRLTRTPESEYSPTQAPDERGISVVRVEMDSTQRLWRIGMSGGHPRLVLPEVKPVGYHAWISPDTLALFVLGDPPTLRIASVRTGEAIAAVEGIGRALHRVPGRHAVAYVDRRDPRDGWIRELDLKSGEFATLAPSLPGSEDFAWAPDGSLLMAAATTLYRWVPGRSQRWEPVADLAAERAGAVTRIAVSPRGDRIAWVAAR
jgi:dipeptidyl aminopeptidase/acylaminoacyl peptidase